MSVFHNYYNYFKKKHAHGSWIQDTNKYLLSLSLKNLLEFLNRKTKMFKPCFKKHILTYYTVLRWQNPECQTTTIYYSLTGTLSN